MYDQEPHEKAGWRRLGPAPSAEEAAPPRWQRARGLRLVRRWSNWSLAALVVGTGTTTVALAQTIPAHTAPAASTASVAPSTSSTAPVTAGTPPPSGSTPVAATSASGVASAANPPAGASPTKQVTAQPRTLSGGDS